MWQNKNYFFEMNEYGNSQKVNLKNNIYTLHLDMNICLTRYLKIFESK